MYLGFFVEKDSNIGASERHPARGFPTSFGKSLLVLLIASIVSMTGTAYAHEEHQASHPAPRPAGGGHPAMGGNPGMGGHPGFEGHPGLGGRPGFEGHSGFEGRPGIEGRPGFGGSGGRPGFNHVEGRPGFGRGGERYGFHGRDVRHFGDRDLAMWRGGRWGQGYHNGRYGWWWNTGGAWYLYDAPIYPYPTMVSETMAEEAMSEEAGMGMGGGGAPPPPPPPMALPPPVQVRYYCEAPAGYYPQVQSCPSGFKPATR